MSKLIIFAALAQIATLTTPAALAVTETNKPQILAIVGNDGQLQQGLKLYQTQQYSKAIEVLQRAAEGFKIKGDSLNQAYSLNYLALAYQQLGLPQANKAIADSLASLAKNRINSKGYLAVRAQALNIQGQVQLAQGQPEKAILSWKEATELYAQNRDNEGEIGSKINQAQALQTLGLYRRAVITLNQVNQQLQQEPDSLMKATGLLSLGNTLRVVGVLDQKDANKVDKIDSLGSLQVLQNSLEVASKLNNPELVAEIHLSLGNTFSSLLNAQEARNNYQQAATPSASKMTRLDALLNQLRPLPGPNVDYPTLWSEIQSLLATLPPSRKTVYAKINFAQTLACLKQRSDGRATNPTCPKQDTINGVPEWSAIAKLVATAQEEAKSLGDKRAEAYALGTLGGLYEQTSQWAEAQKLTQQALALTESIEAPDIGYRWQWQLGRILKARGNQKGAIAAYSKAVDNLKTLRSDLVAINRDVQYSFTEGVEPIYRELVSLLLQPESNQSKSLITAQTEVNQPTQEDLSKARDVIESLQLAELDNFFRRACIDAKPVNIDEVDRTAAVIYPVILGDRMEVIVSMPNSSSNQKSGQFLSHRTILLDKQKVEDTIQQLREKLETRSNFDFLPLSQEMYNWIIKPIESELANRQIKNLVFVLDGSLRGIPMGALHDGKQYLVNKYNIALTPGLQLLNPQPLARTKLRIIAAGLSEGRENFPQLPGVAKELNEIQSTVPGSQVLLNGKFTSNAIENAMKSLSTPVVHLATHGQFSSQAEGTFILTYDGRLNVNELNKFLQTREINRRGAIELLVLSACTTATGDKRAALGMAGVAVRSGARSTLASLWVVDDEATAMIMSEFYRQLNQPKITKAEAFKRAQLVLLENAQYQHPYYWAPYVLVGNWL
ncbi:MAG: CHAT domain-containing protein [Cyanomargarita calcarea GSE-NOS-MK-12-04C]|jgi:CHAT domain-containing protein|uniref:CHAT domain-containing protein n=1 Tax=Cyanomargarita calcarea GSE-NOS-MK-12-04C TaxID=2839659 RepID=A0A951UU38_9CYAN|nr:CHAT domain-containing protein [Cyanomargarita calcarea GSE-NOS-MK-12-04C]